MINACCVCARDDGQVDEMIPVYSNFASHQNEALAALEKAKGKKAFTAFTAELKVVPATKGLELSQFVIMPVQRICKYPLLFKDLMKHTPKEHPDYPNLEKAFTTSENLLAIVNENTRESTNVKAIRDIESSLTGASHIKFLMPGRHFKHKGLLTKISGRNVQVCLYSLTHSLSLSLLRDSLVYLSTTTRNDNSSCSPTCSCMRSRSAKTSSSSRGCCRWMYCW